MYNKNKIPCLYGTKNKEDKGIVESVVRYHRESNHSGPSFMVNTECIIHLVRKLLPCRVVLEMASLPFYAQIASIAIS